MGWWDEITNSTRRLLPSTLPFHEVLIYVRLFQMPPFLLSFQVFLMYLPQACATKKMQYLAICTLKPETCWGGSITDMFLAIYTLPV